MRKKGHGGSGIRVMRKAALLLTASLLGGCACGAAAGERSVTASTQVTKWGQMPVRFEIRGQQLAEGITAADFTITGEAAGWGTAATHPFSCGVAAGSSER